MVVREVWQCVSQLLTHKSCLSSAVSCGVHPQSVGERCEWGNSYYNTDYVGTCSDLCYYNTGNYATIKDRARMIIRLNMKCWAPNIYIWYFCLVRTENVWWRNQGILGVGNRHDNSNRIIGKYSPEECSGPHKLKGYTGFPRCPLVSPVTHYS